MITKCLDVLADEAGMSHEEFIIELRRCFAAHVSLELDGTTGIVHVYKCHFVYHDIIVESRKIPAENVSIN